MGIARDEKGEGEHDDNSDEEGFLRVLESFYVSSETRGDENTRLTVRRSRFATLKGPHIAGRSGTLGKYLNT